MVLKALRNLVRGCRILSLLADEVTAIDMTCWVSIYVHIIERWKIVPQLFYISYVSGTTDHLIDRIMYALMSEL